MKIDYIIIAMMIIGCGLSDPKVVVYENENTAADLNPNSTGTATGSGTSGSTSSGTGDDTNLGLTAFQAVVGPAASGTCTGCHSTTPIADKKLKKGDDAANRLVFLAYMGSSCDTSKLFTKLASPSPKHGGGDQSSAISESALDAWVSKDPDCK